jgi:hypothetical protein
MSKLPAIQFYVGDWLRDPISGCSLGAQGLWLRMMFLMHDAERYGRLEAGGKPMTAKQICRCCGVGARDYRRFFAELMSLSVPSFDESGVIYCRRMVRDAERREHDKVRKREQRRGNGGEYKANDGDCLKDVRPHVPSLSLRSSTSTSTSTSTSSIEYPSLEMVKAKAGMIGCTPEWAEDFFDHYETQGWNKANGQPLTNWAIALKRWAEKNRKTGTPAATANGKGSTSSRAYVLDQREKGLKDELANLQRHRGETATDVIWDAPKYKARWFEAKKELKQIAEQRRALA